MKSKYLKAVGIILLVDYILGAIFLTIELVILMISELFNFFIKFIAAFGYVSFLFFGPAMAVLFLTVAHHEWSLFETSEVVDEIKKEVKMEQRQEAAVIRTSHYSESEAKSRINAAKSMYTKGVISKEELDKRIREIESKIKKD